MHLLKVSSVSKKQEGAFVLRDISLDLLPFQKLAIAGETGSGKSTLLKIIAGLIQPDGGDVLFKDKHVDGPLEKLVPGHPQIAYLSQQYELRNHYRVEELLEYANELSGDEAATLIELCRIGHLLKRWTNQLSGGERQRIALARLLLGAPALLLLDEPFSNLDPVHKNILKTIIRDLGEQLSITCVMVSHDPLDSLPWADQLVLLKNGELVQQGPPEIVYRQPVNEYAAGLLGDYYLVENDGGLPWTAGLPSGNRLFLRPGDLEIVHGDGELPATISEQHFSGNFYEYTVAAGRYTFRIPSFDRTLETGQRVSLNVTSTVKWRL